MLRPTLSTKGVIYRLGSSSPTKMHYFVKAGKKLICPKSNKSNFDYTNFLRFSSSAVAASQLLDQFFATYVIPACVFNEIQIAKLC